MVILESVLLLILLRFFGLGSSENAPKTPAEAARQAQGMRKAADYIKEHGDEKDPEKIKKEVNKEIEESPIPEEEKKDMENGVSNVLNQETVPTPENIEKQAENMEKVSKTFEGLDHDKDGNIINNTKLEEKLEETDPVLPSVVNNDLEKTTEEVLNNNDNKEKQETVEPVNKEVPIEEKTIDPANKEVSVEEKTVEPAEKEVTVEEKTEKGPVKESMNLNSLEDEIKEENALDNYKKSISTTNDMQNEKGLRQTEYLGQISKGGVSAMIPSAVMNLGNTKQLEDFVNRNEMRLPKDSVTHLKNRVHACKVLDTMEANKGLTTLGVMTPSVNGDKVEFEGLKYNEFQNNNECWSYSYSLMLKAKGAEIKPEYVRSFRPGLNINDASQMIQANDNTWVQLNCAMPNSPFEMADLTGKILPNTGMVNVSLMSSENFTKKTEEEKKNTLYEQIKSTVTEGLKKDKSPIAMTLKQNGLSHVTTIVGIDGDNLIIQDSLSTHHETNTPNGIVKGKPDDNIIININDLASDLAKNSSHDNVTFDWLKTLSIDKSGNCPDINALSNGQLKCENGKFSETNVLTGDEKFVHDYEYALIRKGKVGAWSEEKEGLSVNHKLYVPDKMTKNLPTLKKDNEKTQKDMFKNSIANEKEHTI